MKNKLYIIGGIIILSLSLLVFYSMYKLNKCESENKDLKNKWEEINEDLKKDDNDENNDNELADTKKTCTYIETYEFVDYYEKSENELFIIVDNVKSLSKNKLPLILKIDKEDLKKDFVKNQSYEFTLQKDIFYNGNKVLHEYIEIMKIEPTDKTGMEQVNEFCVFE